jgi:hypothetical protein
VRIKEDGSSWHARAIKRRDWRSAPLTPEEETPRRGVKKKAGKKPVVRVRHKHVWEQVEPPRYVSAYPEYYAAYRKCVTHYQCACGKHKSKTDVGKMRVYYHRLRDKRLREYRRRK